MITGISPDEVAATELRTGMPRVRVRGANLMKLDRFSIMPSDLGKCVACESGRRESNPHDQLGRLGLYH